MTFNQPAPWLVGNLTPLDEAERRIAHQAERQWARADDEANEGLAEGLDWALRIIRSVREDTAAATKLLEGS